MLVTGMVMYVLNYYCFQMDRVANEIQILTIGTYPTTNIINNRKKSTYTHFTSSKCRKHSYTRIRRV